MASLSAWIPAVLAMVAGTTSGWTRSAPGPAPGPGAGRAGALAVLAGAGGARDGRVAPDGRRGFGAEISLLDLLRLMRTPDEEEEAFLAGLRGLEQRAEQVRTDLEGLYRARGYFRLCEEGATLDELHAALDRVAEEPLEGLRAETALARAAAGVLSDTRLRLRRELLEDLEAETREVRLGLAVLQGAAVSNVVLSGDEGVVLAARLDLAASLARRLLLDLEALAEPLERGAPTEEVDLWLAWAQAGDEELAALEAALLEALERVARMRRFLFVESFRSQHTEAIGDRRAARRMASTLLDEVRRLWPDGEDDSQAPREIRRMSDTQRRRLTREKAIEGLVWNPLDDELAYLAAISSRVVHGTTEALSHYDRFLVLHGIRSYDHHTFQGRELTAEEDDALFFVQRYEDMVNEEE